MAGFAQHSDSKHCDTAKHRSNSATEIAASAAADTQARDQCPLYPSTG
jgi:hypothetical protein